MCWNKANPIDVSNSLQSNDVIDDPTSKLTQFIYGALKSPTTMHLPLLQQGLSLLRRKSSATHSGLRYTTTNSTSCRRHFSLHHASSHVPETCATVSTNFMVRVLFVYRITLLLYDSIYQPYWLTSEVLYNEIQLTRFVTSRADRLNRRGGAVILYPLSFKTNIH
ncbi:unnamed protein product [Schistosoma margrebowiei]|uniref:Uncharacterized protein n=1 Tax=Schistosoma margrebowiei TaxID=48269 RepID=A0A183M8Q3_9TREM|nr:unnamed protein product [Schistosoma margrebowiei]